MAVKLGINGFGRIGRYLTRLITTGDSGLEIAAINARADNKTLAHLLQYDSCHGMFSANVSFNDEGLIVNDTLIPITRKPQGEWAWKALGVDIAVETTGTIKDRDGLQLHIDAGAKKSVISAPCATADLTVVMGVNDSCYDPDKHNVISNASCTTNCLAPAAKVINDTFGIERGLMTTIHSYTMNQRILDGSHKDLRRGRAACLSMLPTTTGAAKAVSLVIPELAGKLDGMAIRVPTPNVSLVDLVCQLKTGTTAEDVNAALKAAAEGPLKDNMGYTDIPLVSIDYMGSTYGGVVDGLVTTVQDNSMLKLLIWYDNESGFTNQLVRLLQKVSASV